MLILSEADIRPLACKIFPYILFTDPRTTPITVSLELRHCPVTRPNEAVPQAFTDKVIALVHDHFNHQLGISVQVEIMAGGVQRG